LLASSAISCSAAGADVQKALAAIRREVEKRLKGRLVHAIQVGEMGAEVDADVVAAHVMAVIQGMPTLARDGATREKLMRVTTAAITMWPKSRTR
jgi:hypothetical protein